MIPARKKVVLIALDGSPEALRAVALARTVAGQLGAALAAVHVAPGPVPTEQARVRLGLDTHGLKDMPLRMRVGRPAEGILAELHRPEVQILVMTTRIAGDPEREFGSVAREVALATDRPVLGHRPEVGVDPSGTVPPLKRLLVPIDGTRTTAWALRPAVAFVRLLDASLDVVYIAHPRETAPTEPGSMVTPRYVDQPQHEWHDWSKELHERLIVEAAGVAPESPIVVNVRHGDPGHEIVRLAGEGRYDAIVLVRRSHLEPERARTLRYVIQQAPCPLLVVGGPE